MTDNPYQYSAWQKIRHLTVLAFATAAIIYFGWRAWLFRDWNDLFASVMILLSICPTIPDTRQMFKKK